MKYIHCVFILGSHITIYYYYNKIIVVKKYIYIKIKNRY